MGTTPHQEWERNPRTHVTWSRGLGSQEALDHRATEPRGLRGLKGLRGLRSQTSQTMRATPRLGQVVSRLDRYIDPMDSPRENSMVNSQYDSLSISHSILHRAQFILFLPRLFITAVENLCLRLQYTPRLYLEMQAAIQPSRL